MAVTSYRPSGGVGRLLPLVLLVLLVPAAGAGVAMAAFTTFMPLAGGKILVTWVVGPLLLSILLGLAVNTALRLAHVRNVAVGRSVAVFCGVAAAWVASGMFLWFVFRENGEPLPLGWVFRPDVLLLPALTYSPDSDAGFPAAVLLFSAIPFAGIPFVLSRAATTAPYCEVCGRWGGRFGAVTHLAATEDHDVRSLIRSWDPEALLAMRRATDDDDLVDVIEASRCPGCRAFAVVRVKRIGYEGGKTWVAVRMLPHVAPGADVDLLAGLVREARG